MRISDWSSDVCSSDLVLPGFTETGRIEQIVRGKVSTQGKSEDEVRAAMRAGVPAGRFATPQETGGVIAFLCSPAAAYVNGVSLAVDGGRMNSISRWRSGLVPCRSGFSREPVPNARRPRRSDKRW